MDKLPLTYACYSKSKRILEKSSSGGVFYSIASQLIRKYHCVVYGVVCEWDEIFHSRAETIEQLLPMLGSKYARSELRNTFFECRNDLENGRYVLFSGTPCQINALHFYLDRFGVDKTKLISIDVVCHGTPMQKYWKEYLSINFSDLTTHEVNFRYKKYGWEKLHIKIGDYVSSFNNDPYIRLFLKNMILHESCFSCNAKGENRKSDITLGDFWGINSLDSKSVNKYGTSLVFIRNKLSFLLTILKKDCVIKEMPYLNSFYISNWAYYKSVEDNSKDFEEKDLLIVDTNRKTEKTNRNTVHSFLHFVHWNLKFKKVKPSVIHNNKNRKHNGKIGIITDYGYSNYGNRLQNFALMYFLRKLGKKPQNIVPFYKDVSDSLFVRFLTFFKFNNEKKYKNFEYFKRSIFNVSKRYEKKSLFIDKTKTDKKKMCSFETILVGSDQIWGPYHPYKDDLEFSLGNFGIINRPFKLASYAVSICTKNLNVDRKEAFYYSLINFDSISVREEEGKVLLNSIGIPSIVVVDPTLLLSKTEWDIAIEKYKTINAPRGRYLFRYLLKSNRVYKTPASYDCIVDVMDNNNNYYSANQFDFVNLIKESSLVITNSFHALVFCIIYRKKIIIYDRGIDTMEERVQNLLNLLHINLHYNEEIDFACIDYKPMLDLINNSKEYLQSIVHN